MELPFGQTFEGQDIAIIGLLVLLEGVLSIDNALVLGLLAKKLPKKLQKRALTYGLVGAFVFRLIAIATASLLLKWWVVKLLGGGYLVYVAVKHLLTPASPEQATGNPPDADPEKQAAEARAQTRAFWSAVVTIELTDIAFAVDSILAAIALVASSAPATPGHTHPKLWVVVAGGFLGVVLMRFAAVVFIKLLERFPRFEMAAYLLVGAIGGKLLVDWYFNRRPDDAPLDWQPPVDFHSPESAAFWVFWIVMLLCFAAGFLPQKKPLAPPV